MEVCIIDEFRTSTYCSRDLCQNLQATEKDAENFKVKNCTYKTNAEEKEISLTKEIRSIKRHIKKRNKVESKKEDDLQKKLKAELVEKKKSLIELHKRMRGKTLTDKEKERKSVWKK